MKFTFEFEEQDTQIIVNALMERPYKEVFRILGKIQNQIDKQVAPKPKKVKEGKE